MKRQTNNGYQQNHHKTYLIKLHIEIKVITITRLLLKSGITKIVIFHDTQH